MSSLRFLVDVNVGMAVASSLRDGGYDVVFAGEQDWRMPDIEMLSLASHFCVCRQGRLGIRP